MADWLVEEFLVEAFKYCICSLTVWSLDWLCLFMQRSFQSDISTTTAQAYQSALNRATGHRINLLVVFCVSFYLKCLAMLRWSSSMDSTPWTHL